ncbi:hypothetical protein [Aquibium oceanicum]|uniref:hypothetical protein n=1 Tax=Aquibium oceanicum TaxID=1670800 RepID=UPI0012FF8B1E|nr:hypothetical protein [Aquibium oceanicum]
MAGQQAKLMYAAIVYFGPKWKFEDGLDGSVLFEWRNPYNEDSYETLKKWVAETNPSLAEIDSLGD